jgi:probable rRNA maturation factor
MPYIVIQRPYQKGFVPKATALRDFASRVLDVYKPNAEVTIRIVSTSEMQALNRQYRHQDKPTNVRSFIMDVPDGMDLSPMPLGDIVICADVVNQEAAAENIPPLSHWAHIVIHGTLHLLGYDHQTDQEADMMQAIESTFMQQFGFTNPYLPGVND